MTKTNIVNLALAKLGSSLVTRLGDASIPGSHFGELLYQPTLERVLRDFPWSFASREKSLPQMTVAQSVEYDYSYSLPSDFIRIREIQGDVRYLKHEEFSRTGDAINTDRTPALLKYVSMDVTPDEFDPDFQEAFVVLLASELATPLLQSPQLAQTLKQEYLGTALPKAKAIDARETESKENNGPYEAIARSPLNQARFQRW